MIYNSRVVNKPGQKAALQLVLKEENVAFKQKIKRHIS